MITGMIVGSCFATMILGIFAVDKLEDGCKIWMLGLIVLSILIVGFK